MIHRDQYVSITGFERGQKHTFSSGRSLVARGVPHGSIICSVLFRVDVDRVDESVPMGRCFKYNDDSSVVIITM